MPAKEVHALFGATTRYIAGRNALQTSYWRTNADGRMVKYSKTCEFDRSQKIPIKLRYKNYDQGFNEHHN